MCPYLAPAFECLDTTQVLRPKKHATNINNIPKPNKSTFSFPVTEKLASPTIVELPIPMFNLTPSTPTNALGLKPTSEKADAEKGVAPKYMRGYLAVAGMLLDPTND